MCQTLGGLVHRSLYHIPFTLICSTPLHTVFTGCFTRMLCFMEIANSLYVGYFKIHLETIKQYYTCNTPLTLNDNHEYPVKRQAHNPSCINENEPFYRWRLTLWCMVAPAHQLQGFNYDLGSLCPVHFPAATARFLREPLLTSESLRPSHNTLFTFYQIPNTRHRGTRQL